VLFVGGVRCSWVMCALRSSVFGPATKQHLLDAGHRPKHTAAGPTQLIRGAPHLGMAQQVLGAHHHQGLAELTVDLGGWRLGGVEVGGGWRLGGGWGVAQDACSSVAPPSKQTDPPRPTM